MNEQKIAYVVTSGNYSDYSINAVFSTKALAEHYVGNSGHHEIEEWPMDYESDISDCQAFFVKMRRDGEVISIASGTRLLEYAWSWSSIPDGCLEYISITKSEDIAAKAANDLRAQLIALDWWGLSQWDIRNSGKEDPYPRSWKTPNEIEHEKRKKNERAT